MVVISSSQCFFFYCSGIASSKLKYVSEQIQAKQDAM